MLVWELKLESELELESESESESELVLVLVLALEGLASALAVLAWEEQPEQSYWH